MTDLPAPPVPADLDLRDFRWMKLDLAALFNSDFNTTADDTAWRAGVTLWGKAWHQVPAGSLPDDDATLCNLAGLGRDLKTWKRIRATAMHGFTRCSDGRLYHAFLCKMALSAATERQRKETAKAADRARKSRTNSDGIPPENTPVPPEPPPGIPAEFSHMERERENKRDSPPIAPPRGAGGDGLFDGLELDRWENDPTAPVPGNHPVVAGWYLDVVWRDVAEAAGIPDPDRWRGRLGPLVKWLRAGVEHDAIVATVRGMCASNPAATISLARFDKTVMRRAAERGAA